MSKPQKQCIFCDNPAGSKEHIWSSWMHDLLEGQAGGTYNRHTITRWPDGRVEKTGPAGKSGGVFNIQVRAVCSSCNSGWMNRAEGAVKPFLGKMIKGDPVTLNAEQIAALARWCAQKFVVMEHAAHETTLIPRSDRVALKEHGVIPPYFRIYVANHVSSSKSGSVRHSHTLALSDEGPTPPLDATERNIQTISLLMGRLFIHLNAARVDGFDIESRYFVTKVWDECRIWPDPNCSLSWPSRPLLDNSGLSMVSTASMSA